MSEYPKWVYCTDGPQASYEAGMEPVLVTSAEAEAALFDAVTGDVPVVRRGRPRKVVAE